MTDTTRYNECAPGEAAIAARLQDRVSAFIARCRRKGVRATHQRIEIFRELAATSEHPDVATIFRRVRERIPTLALDTVYRTLCLLNREGLVHRVDALCDRARFDADMTPHPHFICTECGCVLDLPPAAFPELSGPETSSRLGRVHSVHIQVRGLCAQCVHGGAYG